MEKLLKENVTHSYNEARKLSVHLVPLVVVKLRKLIEHDLLEHILLRVASGQRPL